MVDEPVGPPFDGEEKASEGRIADAVAVGHVDELVIGRHPLLLRVEGASGVAGEIHLVELEIAKGADDRIHLARDQRRGEREADIDELDVLHREPMPAQHGLQQGVLEAAHRVADLPPPQVGDGADAACVEHHEGVERRGDEGSDPHERQPLGDLEVELGLVGDREIGLLRRHELGRIVGIRGGDELDLEPRVAEETLLVCDHERAVIGVDEPVEHEGEAFRPRGLCGGEQERGEEQGAPSHLPFSVPSSRVSFCQ